MPDVTRDPQAYCTAVTKASGSNFYYAFMPLPRERRDALFTIYAFCRHADDIVDEGDDPVAAASTLDAWREEWAAARAGHPGHPITLRLAQVVERFGIDPGLPDLLLDGMAMDLGLVRYETFDELREYCYRVASVVGLMCIRAFGCNHPDTDRFADAHGMAFQLTNILRDVGKDAQMGRIYLPAEDMRRFRVSEDDLTRGRYTTGVRELMTFQYHRARGYYGQADAIARALPPAERRALLPSRIMGAIYGALLEEMAEREFRLMHPVSLSAPRKLYLAARACLGSLGDRW